MAPPNARPPRASPESFNASRLVIPSDISFLVLFIFCSPFVIGYVLISPNSCHPTLFVMTMT
jgi:hypothetical protein